MAVSRIKEMECARIPTEVGEFQLCFYSNKQDRKEHLALLMGDVRGQSDVLVRIHSECFTGDVIGSKRCDCGEQFSRAMQIIAESGSGVIIYLRQEGRGIGLLDKLRAYNLQDLGYDTVDANLLLGHQPDKRDYTVAAHILKDLGIKSVRLLTNNPKKIDSLNKFGIPVADRIPLYGTITHDNAHYLSTKNKRMNHLLPYGNATAGLNHETIVKQINMRLEQAATFRKRTGRPYVTLSYAQTLDSSIAIQSGNQLKISCPQSQTLTHILRSMHDAILVGIGTVLSDNPQLTVRLVAGKDPQPVILDSRLRIPMDANLLQNHSLPPWIMTSESADKQRQTQLEAANANVFRLSVNGDNRINLDEMLRMLDELDINSLMVEGGAQIITSFINAQLVDQLVLTVAPVFVGGLRAVGVLGQNNSNGIPGLVNLKYQPLGCDLIVRGDFDWERK